jgi:hypothetical protein
MSTNRKGQRHKKVQSQKYLKTVHSFRDQVMPLRCYLNDMLKLIPSYSEPGKRQALLDQITNVVKDHGNSGLKKFRPLYILGVRVLGGESVSFDGFALDKGGFPKHYGDLFRALLKARENISLEYSKRDYYRNKAVIDREVEVIRIVLSILKWPYSIKLELNQKIKDQLLEDFAVDITDFNPKVQYPAIRLGERLVDVLRDFNRPRNEVHGTIAHKCYEALVFAPSQRTYKGWRPNHRSDRRIPSSVAFACLNHETYFSYEGPTGKTTVLGERAGKTRFITNYDGAINSTNFYEKVTSWLHELPGDCSQDQSKGHKFAQSKSLEPSSDPILSVDLRSFSDNIHLNAVLPFLSELGCLEFRQVICSEIIVGNRVIQPHHMLMGLKGTFELSSLVHHGIVLEALTRSDDRTGAKGYCLCGDDLIIRANARFLKSYEFLCSCVGLEINLSKTVSSADTCTFCGKVYHRGLDVTPVVPPLFTFRKGANDFVVAAGSFISSLADRSKSVKTAARKLVLAYGKFYKNIRLPYTLPSKLGGLGITLKSGPRGLLSILGPPSVRTWARFSLEEDEPLEQITVRYPASDPYIVKIASFCNNLVVRGATLRKKRKDKPCPRSMLLKDVCSCLEYYYFG